jgi:hypothetical protein
MDLVRLEDVVEKPMVSGLEVVVDVEAGWWWCCHTRAKRSRADVPPSVWSTRKDTNSPRDMQCEMWHRHAFGGWDLQRFFLLA